MVEYEGSVLRPPGVGTESQQPEVEELLGSTVGYTQKGGTIASGTGVLKVGAPVKFNTGTGYWEKSTIAAGSTTAGEIEGFVRHAVDATSEAKLINVVVKGTIRLAVEGLDSVDVDDIVDGVGGGARLTPAFGWLTF